MSYPKGKKIIRWNQAQKQFLADNYPTYTAIELTELINKRFNLKRNYKQIHSAAKRFGIKSGRDGRYKPGNKPHPDAGAKGPNATSFKKGNKPHNWQPIGHERWCGSHHKYLQRKVTDTGHTVSDYVEVHRIVWMEHHGPIPDGNIIIFRDGNNTNFDIENLMMVSRGDHAQMCKMGLYNGHAETKDAALLLVQIMRKRRMRAKNIND